MEPFIQLQYGKGSSVTEVAVVSSWRVFATCCTTQTRVCAIDKFMRIYLKPCLTYQEHQSSGTVVSRDPLGLGHVNVDRLS
jgi:hypothetical protein